MDRSVVYRAKENNNITIKWSIEMKTNFTLINMMCEMYTDNVKIVYETIRGSQKSADEQFAGRVHFDVDAPREAKIKLHLSRLKVEDSGHYCCYLNADYDDKAWRWRLQMTGENKPQDSDRFFYKIKKIYEINNRKLLLLISPYRTVCSECYVCRK